MSGVINLVLCFFLVGRCMNVDANPVLRYDEDSCESLEPNYVKQTYNEFNLGIKKDDDENSDLEDLSDSPKKHSSRNPPFEINVMFDQYRRNREYKVEIIADKDKYFDAFMLQARGKEAEAGNATFVGEWIMTPKIARTIKCLRYRRAAVIDIGRPIQFGNLSFTWRSPKNDKGPVKFQASVVYQGKYLMIDAKINGSKIKNGRGIPYEAFPMELKGCKTDKGCFRYCESRPNCPVEEAAYMVTIETENSNDDLDSNEVLIKIGGYLKDNKTNFIGIGLSRDSYRMRNSDVVVCVRDENAITGEHYLLEDINSVPHRHKLNINLDSAGVDSETGFTWCAFKRNIEPRDPYDLDLRRHYYQIYLWGDWNVSSSRPMISQKSRILNSYMRLNVSEPYSEIVFTGGHSLGSNRLSHDGFLFTATTFLLLTFVYL